MVNHFRNILLNSNGERLPDGKQEYVPAEYVQKNVTGVMSSIHKALFPEANDDELVQRVNTYMLLLHRSFEEDVLKYDPRFTYQIGVKVVGNNVDHEFDLPTGALPSSFGWDLYDTPPPAGSPPADYVPQETHQRDVMPDGSFAPAAETSTHTLFEQTPRVDLVSVFRELGKLPINEVPGYSIEKDYFNHGVDIDRLCATLIIYVAEMDKQ